MHMLPRTEIREQTKKIFEVPAGKKGQSLGHLVSVENFARADES